MLKIAALLSLIFLSLSLHAQLPKGPVTEAKKISLQGKDPMGEMVQIDGLDSYVFVKDCHQRQDSPGVWHTDFEFGNSNRIIAHNITIILQCDHATDSIIFITKGIPENVRTTHPAGNFAASWSATELSANGTITANPRKSGEDIYKYYWRRRPITLNRKNYRNYTGKPPIAPWKSLYQPRRKAIY